MKSVRYLQTSFGTTWSEAFGFALRILGINARVDVRWCPAASVDDKDFWEMAGQKIDAGVLRYQVLLEAGYTADQLAAWGLSPDQTDVIPTDAE